jgi:transposase-like protein
MTKPQEERHRYWRQMIAQQEQSGQSVRAFCQQRGISDPNFYQWRKRLAEQLPMRFALVETRRSAPAATVGVELMLTTGERLRVAPGADAATLRLVLSVLREPR